MANISSPFGQNEWLVEEMYRKFRDDPSSVDPSWHEFLVDYSPEPTSQPAAAPPPGDVTEAPAETPQVSNIAYTKKLWQAIRAQDVCGNDALDSLAQPYVIG